MWKSLFTTCNAFKIRNLPINSTVLLGSLKFPIIAGLLVFYTLFTSVYLRELLSIALSSVFFHRVGLSTPATACACGTG